MTLSFDFPFGLLFGLFTGKLSVFMQSKTVELPLSDRLFAWFDANQKPALGVAAAALLVGLVAWFIVWEHQQRADKAADALSSVTVAQILSGAARPDETEAYLKVAGQYPGSSAGARASLLAAGSLFTQGQYAQAQAQFERFARDYPDSPFMGEALFGIASCLDAEGKTDLAMTSYKELISRHPNESFIYQAKFALASLYEAQNKLESARDLFSEVQREDRFGSVGDEAARRLNDLLTRYPKLAPSAPSPAPASGPMLLPKK